MNRLFAVPGHKTSPDFFKRKFLMLLRCLTAHCLEQVDSTKLNGSLDTSRIGKWLKKQPTFCQNRSKFDGLSVKSLKDLQKLF